MRQVQYARTIFGVLLLGWNSLASAQRTVAVEHTPDTEASSAILSRPVTVQLNGVSLRQAVIALGAAAQVRLQYHVEWLDAANRSVTLRVTGVPLGMAFERVLAGTALQAVALGTDVIGIERVVGASRVDPGKILGHVTIAKTAQPARGVKISLDGNDRVAETRDDGGFEISNVTPGSHTMTAKLLGYMKVVQTVAVSEGVSTTVNVTLEPSVNTLDQVVVTGMVIPTELKAVPNAITVITAKQIEERGITKIDQLFRGDVPGVFAQNRGASAALDLVTMYSRGATALTSFSAGTSFNTNPIKTYVDGVELADPEYLSQIDPKSIERIEIVTGPQASTIYGSGAINGVMQIFTKRGTSSTPQLTLSLLSGWVENNFSNARTPQHDYSAQLSGIEGRLSYTAGGTWNYIGAWTPGNQTARTSAFTGIRLDIPTLAGRVTADMTLRRGLTRTWQRGSLFQTETGYRELGWYTNLSSSGLMTPTTRTLMGQTLGFTLSYAPTSWWSHELGLGTDASDAEQRFMALGYTAPSDTMLLLRQEDTDRRSLRYTTTAHISVTSVAQATVTAGIDGWQNMTSSVVVQPQTLTGTLTGTTVITRQPGHNTGGFLQTQLGLKDRLFLTYGLRAEWNPAFGADAEPSYAPRYGVAYTQDFQAVTAKLRGSYGRSTRPPHAGIRAAQTAVGFYGSSWPLLAPFYASFDRYLANPDLAPEHQQGGEGGLELYFGTHSSLVVTRYNQTVDGLIDLPVVDSVRSLVVNPTYALSRDVNGYGYWYQQQYVNLGSIRNQGWELQSSVNAGPLTTKGTYSWTKSRVIGITPKYQAYFANQPQYASGATFQYLPEHTWALGVTYVLARSTIGLNVTGTGRATNFGDDFYFRNLNSAIRLLQNRFNISNTGGYISANDSYTVADLTASYRVTSRVQGVLAVQNLMDHYVNDYFANSATIGRQVKLGARVQP